MILYFSCHESMIRYLCRSQLKQNNSVSYMNVIISHKIYLLCRVIQLDYEIVHCAFVVFSTMLFRNGSLESSPTFTDMV